LRRKNRFCEPFFGLSERNRVKCWCQFCVSWVSISRVEVLGPALGDAS
jgi:hypothetical protein